MIEDFMKIYDLQDAGQSFANVTMLLSAINKEFPKLLQMSTTEYLLQMDFSKKLINELVQAAIVVNYGQEVDIQSFVGCIAVAASDGLWSVKGGNKKVIINLLSILTAHKIYVKYKVKSLGAGASHLQK